MHMIGLRITGRQLDNNPGPFIGMLDFLKITGFDHIEICPEDFDALQSGELIMATVLELKKILSDYPFSKSVHVPIPLNLFNRDNPDLHKRVLESCYNFTNILGGSTLVYHPGRYVDSNEFVRFGREKYSAEEKLELKIIEQHVLRTFAVNYPEILTVIENQRPYIDYSPYCYGEDPGELEKQISDIGMENVGLAIDTGHLQLAAGYFGYDVIGSIGVNDIKPMHFHINDNHGITSYYTEKDKKSMLPFGRGDEHVPPGMGTFPFTEFLNWYPGYKGVYVIELSERYIYQSAIKKSYDYLRDILSKIK